MGHIPELLRTVTVGIMDQKWAETKLSSRITLDGARQVSICAFCGVKKRKFWLNLAPVLLLVLLLAVPLHAQINTTGSTNCTDANFDTDVQFLNGPEDQFLLLIQKRNIGNHACVFDGPTYGLSLVPDRVEGQRPFEPCYFCQDRLPNGQVASRPAITVEPGQVVLQTFRWKTKPEADSIHCVTLRWLAGPILLVTPSLLKPVCSDVDVSHFTLETAQETATARLQSPAFELSGVRTRYYMSESFSLRLAPVRGSDAITPNPESCPIFYLRHRSPDGNTRIDEVKPITSIGCKTFIPGRRPINSETSFEIDSGANSRWEGAGEHVFQVRQLTGSTDDARVTFISSNTFRLEIADPASIARRWGGRAKGVGVDVTLDKDTYQVGEDIPLHMAVEDFDAASPIYTWDPLWDPCLTVGVTVVDLRGYPLKENERFPGHLLCMGHGFGPRAIQKGKIIAIESNLAGEGWLPNQPGTYSVSVRWAPCTGKTVSGQPFAQDLKTYADIKATATIHIIRSEAVENTKTK